VEARDKARSPRVVPELDEVEGCAEPPAERRAELLDASVEEGSVGYFARKVIELDATAPSALDIDRLVPVGGPGDPD